MWDAAISAASGGCPSPSAPRQGTQREQQSLAEMMRDAKERAEQNRDRFRPQKNGRYGETTMEAYARLARARTQGEVNSAAGYARRQIVRFRGAMQTDRENAPRIKAAINQLQKAVLRAGKKKRELCREQIQEQRQKNALEEERRREAARLRQELLRRKTLRSLREQAYLTEAEIDNRLQGQLAAVQAELRAQVPQAAQPCGTTPQTAAQQYSAAMSGEAAPAPTFTAEA